AAVLSIAYGKPLAVLDGNVARVLARWGVVRGDLRSPRRWAPLGAAAAKALAVRSPGDWNQALMELGATVCTPVAPRCGECPLAAECVARQRGLQDVIPRKADRAAVTEVGGVALGVGGGPRVLRVRRPADARRWANMWEFPH